MLSELESNLSVVNPIVQFLGGQRVFTNNQYWTREEQSNSDANQYTIGTGASSISKTSERIVRPFAIVPL